MIRVKFGEICPSPRGVENSVDLTAGLDLCREKSHGRNLGTVPQGSSPHFTHYVEHVITSSQTNAAHERGTLCEYSKYNCVNSPNIIRMIN